MVKLCIVKSLQGSFFSEIRERCESRKNRPSTSNRQRSEADTPIRDDGFGGNLGQDEIGKNSKNIYFSIL